MEAAKTIKRFKEFFEKDYESRLKDSIRKGKKYIIVDFSDGSRGRNDHDDWSNMDLTSFQNRDDWIYFMGE